MYEELVKRLREHGEFLIVSDMMKAPPNVNVRNVFAEDYAQAADAIEELQQTVEHYEGCAEDWYKEACDYKAMLPRWIPVTEQLPKPGEESLVLASQSGMEVALYEEGFYGEAEWFTTSCKLEGVTHWMPLPQPPKEET